MDLGQADVARGAITGRTIGERSIAGCAALGRAGPDEKQAAAGALGKFSHGVAFISTAGSGLQSGDGDTGRSSGAGTDARSRTYVVTRFGSEMSAPAGAAPPLASNTRKRRRRSTRGKTQGRGLAARKQDSNDLPNVREGSSDEPMDAPMQQNGGPERPEINE